MRSDSAVLLEKWNSIFFAHLLSFPSVSVLHSTSIIRGVFQHKRLCWRSANSPKYGALANWVLWTKEEPRSAWFSPVRPSLAPVSFLKCRVGISLKFPYRSNDRSSIFMNPLPRNLINREEWVQGEETPCPGRCCHRLSPILSVASSDTWKTFPCITKQSCSPCIFSPPPSVTCVTVTTTRAPNSYSLLYLGILYNFNHLALLWVSNFAALPCVCT